MITTEFEKKGGFLQGAKYGLSVVLVGRTEDQLVDELREARQLLIDWLGSRGRSADLVMFAVMSPAMHVAAEATLRDLVAQDADLSVPLQKRTVVISLAALGGKRTDGEWTWSGGRWREGSPEPGR